MSKKVTITDIAKTLGISVTTVSFVLNGDDKGISLKTKEKVLKAAQTLGYKKKFISNNNKNIKVAFLSSKIEYFNFYTSFFSNVYNNIQRKSIKYNIELSLLEFNLEKDIKFLNEQVDVFITTSYDSAKFLQKNGMKVILAQSGAYDDLLCVYCDDSSAGKLVAKCAITNNHKIAGTVFPYATIKSPRFDGFLDEFTRNHGETPKELQCVIPNNILLENSASYISDFYLDKIMPTFIYCFADNVIFPTIRAFNEIGLKVPDDISVMGTDNLYWGALNTPPFSTIDLCEDLFATQIINAIIHIYKNKSVYQLSVPVKLLERGTVKNIN